MEMLSRNQANSKKSQKQDTKRLQVNIEAATLDTFDFVADRLGMSRTSIINNFVTRVAATGSIPYTNQLTEREMADKNLMEAMELIPSRSVEKMSQLSEWLSEDE